ncbi:MAG TPA: hypothetical protein VFM99_01320, partial [Chitinophagales bacterium]|nr:hypothetical protein [Chitinophagales bacterium]
MKNIKYLLLTILNCHAVILFSQITPPASPTFQQKQEPYYYYPKQSNISNTVYVPSNNMGSTADNLTQQTNAQAMRMMGYNPPSVPPSDPYLAHQFIMNQYKTQEAGNNQYGISKAELSEVLNEIHTSNERYNSSGSTNVEVLNSYKSAYSKISNMLSGKSKLSYADASYYMESAYGNAYLKYDEFKSDIAQSADFLKKWMAQNKIPVTPQNIHYAIQQFMGDTISLTTYLPDAKQEKKTTTHFPFKYDYDDYDGKKDYRNYFASKCLATGTGQCNSMPMVYLMLCEAMGVKGYLSFAPFHSFIKYKNNEGKIV